MRKYIYLLLIVLFTSISGLSQIKDPEAIKLYKQGITEHDNGNYDKAISLYKEALAIEPDNEMIIYEMGYTYNALKDYSKIVTIVSDRIKKGNIKIPDLYVLLGNTYDIMKDPDNSTETYKDGLKKFPNSGQMYYNYGITLAGQKKWDDALEKFEKGIAMDPSYPSNFYMAARLLSNSGEDVWAILYSEMFMNLDAGSDRAIELSKVIYNFYQKKITKTDEGYTINMNPLAILESGDNKSNISSHYEMMLMLGVVALEKNGTNIDGYAAVRSSLAEMWNESNKPELQNIVFDRAKEISAVNKDYLTAYNYLMLAYGDPDGFKKWYGENKQLFEEFADWMAEHPLKFPASAKYYRQQYE